MGLFKTSQQRQMDRELQIRRSISRIERFIRESKKLQQKYWDMGKQALKLGDRDRFKQVASTLTFAKQRTSFWEKSLLKLEAMRTAGKESEVMGELLKGVDALTMSIMRSASPQELTAMQTKMERANIAWENRQELLSLSMDSESNAVLGCQELDDHALDELAKQMGSEAAIEEGDALDDRISQGMKNLEEEMRKES
jgi:hypothetical protein